MLAEDPYRHPPTSGADEPLEKGPNIGSMPTLDPLPKRLEVRVLLSLPADVSTDEILPAGTRVLPYRSNIDKIADFCFEPYETKDGRSYAEAARELRSHAVVAGENYGQGSSREHAALAPRHLGLRLVLATSLSRIHRANLINYGVLPLLFKAPEDKDAVSEGDTLGLDTARLAPDRDAAIEVAGKKTLRVAHDLSERELEVIFAGGRIAEVRNRVTADRT